MTTASALVVIDMQNDFCLPESALCVKGALGCLSHVINAVDKARKAKVPVIWVIREHHPSGQSRPPPSVAATFLTHFYHVAKAPTPHPQSVSLLSHQFLLSFSGVDVEIFRSKLFDHRGHGCTVPGTHGAALVDGLAVASGELVVIKKRFSAFMHTNLESLLRRLGVQHVVIAGVQTPNCIRQTAFDAVGLDFPDVTVLEDATASAVPEVQDANLYDMRNVGIHVVTVAQWAATLPCDS